MMETQEPGTVVMGERKRVALIAHDNCKEDLLDWARFNRGTLGVHELFATGTTGALLASELGLKVTRFLSGPLGGDQQVGAAIVEGRLDFVIFFWDPLEPHPHDVDVKALLRIAVVYNIPIACNRSTADFLLSSPLMHRRYERRFDDRHPTPGAAIA
jgi:methylglyoxal synthase